MDIYAEVKSVYFKDLSGIPWKRMVPVSWVNAGRIIVRSIRIRISRIDFGAYTVCLRLLRFVRWLLRYLKD